MICLNCKDLPLLEELKNIRAETEITLDKNQKICSDESMKHSEDQEYQEYLKQKRKTQEHYESMAIEHATQLSLAKQKQRETLINDIKEFNPEAMFADGFDDSILGYDTKGRVVYSVDSILETLTERDGMSVDEAREYFDFNIDGAYVGEYTPIYIY
jgi:hypothetical protein